ncbi:MAG: CPBP family glutamic-type intramembrane protease [candidate division FCPU426 bacterium]
MNWKVLFTLWAAGSLSLLAVFPAIAASAHARAGSAIPLAWFFAGQYAQTVLLLGLAVWLGARLAPAVGLGAPLLEAWFSGQPVAHRLKSSLVFPAVWGLLAGTLLQLLALLVRVNLQAGAGQAWVDRLLASFYAGIGEELWMRWLLVTLGMWLLAALLRVRAGAWLPAWSAWLIIAVVSLASGFAHLRGGAAGNGPAAWFAAQTVLQGLLFGWCYWRRGLEAAMACHWTASFVTQFLPVV